MKVAGQHYRTIWVAEDGSTVEVINQTKLPHVFEVLPLKTWGSFVWFMTSTVEPSSATHIVR